VPLIPGTVRLDAARLDGPERRSFAFANPRRVLRADDPHAVADALAEAERAVHHGQYVAGVVTYEAGAALLGLLHRPPAPLPYVWLGVYDRPVNRPGPPSPAGSEGLVSNVRPLWDEAAYAERHAEVQRLIREGDVYQINLTFPLTFGTAASPEALYAALLARQPVPFGALLVLDDGLAVASVSPELFFRLDGRTVTTRPMKGTRPRGATAAADDALRADLTASAKERAENLMIVDLLRNDLSVVCEPGSVVVPELFATESHPTLHQMTSTVQGTVRPEAGLADLFAALFPSGSITGAPKRRAMQRIAALETEPRGAYCGAIGAMGPGPDGPWASFSVAIRTATLHDGRGTLGVGSGVVWGADAAAEYRECLLKARFLTDLAV